MTLEELDGKKLIRIFKWFYYRNSSYLFEFEDQLSVSIWAGNTKLFTKYDDLLLFLDNQELSDVFYTEKYYRKRSALEEYSREVFGSVKAVYKKYPKVVSVDCTQCIWRKYYKSKKRCRNCWALQWNSDNPKTLEVINVVT